MWATSLVLAQKMPGATVTCSGVTHDQQGTCPSGSRTRLFSNTRTRSEGSQFGSSMLRKVQVQRVHIKEGVHSLYREQGKGNYDEGHPYQEDPHLPGSSSEAFGLRDSTIRGIHKHIPNAMGV